jgi:hypothetical protein
LFRRRHRLQGVNYLDLVPRHVVDAAPESDSGRVILLVPRYRDFLYSRLVQPFLRGDKRWIKIPLDPRGSWLWEQVDGRRTVGELARGFREAFPEDAEQVEERVSQYVAALVGNGFLAVE